MNTKTLVLLRQKNSTLNSIKILIQLLVSNRDLLISILAFGFIPSVLVILSTSIILGSDSQGWYFVFALVYSLTNIIVLNSIIRKTFSFLEIAVEASPTKLVDLLTYCLIAGVVSLIPYLVESTLHPNVFLSALLIPIAIYLSFLVMNAFIELQTTGNRPEYNVWEIIKKTNTRVYSGVRTYMGLAMVFIILSMPFFIVFAMGQQIAINRVISYLVGSLAGSFFPALFLTDQIKHDFYITNETKI